MAQTIINSAGQPIGREGQLADLDDAHVVTGFNSEATAAIPFGRAVKKDTTDNSGRSWKQLAGLSDQVGGVTVFSYRHQQGTTGDLDASGNQIPGAAMDIVDRGRIMVIPFEAVSVDDRPMVQAVATGTNLAGTWWKTANASYLIDVGKNGKYVTQAAAQGLAVVDVDFRAKS